jgi:hypothetical protein
MVTSKLYLKNLTLLRYIMRCFCSFIVSANIMGASVTQADTLDNLGGRLIRAALRFPPDAFGKVIASPPGESVDYILVELINGKVWQTLKYEEKREFALIAFLFCDIEGGEKVLLVELLGREANRMGADLGTIKDEVLVDKFGLSPVGIKQFHKRIDLLRKRETSGNHQ